MKKPKSHVIQDGYKFQPALIYGNITKFAPVTIFSQEIAQDYAERAAKLNPNPNKIKWPKITESYE